MLRSFISIVLTLAAVNCIAQQGKVVGGKATAFQITENGDTIDFLILDTALTEKKPLFLFCQGSLPVSLFINLEKYGLYMLAGSNFDLKEIKKHYHPVIISMPKTPLIVDEKELNESYCYIPPTSKSGRFSKEYVGADYLQNYVDRGNAVLEFLSGQDWVDSEKLIVAGHSQGARIATKIAVVNDAVTHLGLFGANPNGRIDQLVRQARRDVLTGKITQEEADAKIIEHYQFYRNAFNPDSVAAMPHLLSWKTFSEPFIDDWLSLNIPIYLAYGSEDFIAELCDLAPLEFIRAGKDNLTVKRYLHYDHNFFEVDENAKPIRDKKHWPGVMNNFIFWTLN